MTTATKKNPMEQLAKSAEPVLEAIRSHGCPIELQVGKTAYVVKFSGGQPCGLEHISEVRLFLSGILAGLMHKTEKKQPRQVRLVSTGRLWNVHYRDHDNMPWRVLEAPELPALSLGTAAGAAFAQFGGEDAVSVTVISK